MDPRRLTIFPRTVQASGNIRTIRGEGSTSAIEAPKPKFYSGDGPLDVEPLRLPAISRAMHKTFTPIDGDPGRHYRCIHIVDPEGERPYCLAQEIAADATGHAYRVVMIRRSLDKSVVGPDKPNPNLLNIVSVFRFQASIFTAFDRPGLPLSEVAVSHSPQLGLAEVRTISTQVGLWMCTYSSIDGRLGTFGYLRSQRCRSSLVFS
jgi:hypothetical protein